MSGKIRKILMTLLLVFICVAAFALDADTGSINYYTECADNAEYAALLKHVFDDEGLDGALELYAVLAGTVHTYGYEQWVQDLFVARAALIVGRYANDEGNEAVAKAYLNAADSLIAQGRADGAPESAAGVLEALSTSFWYLVDGSISKGLAFGRIVGDLWDEYPEDFHVLLLTADKYLHSPGIAGGNKKKGLEYYQFAEAVALENGCAVWDMFSIYAGLAVGYDKNKEEELALEYAYLADEIYTADVNVVEIIEEYGN